jgi:hypothetical protein
MLRKLISAALNRDVAENDSAALSSGPVDRPAPDLAFAPMVPLQPPEAQNDNPLAALCVAVEADLRAAGYLR